MGGSGGDACAENAAKGPDPASPATADRAQATTLREVPVTPTETALESHPRDALPDASVAFGPNCTYSVDPHIVVPGAAHHVVAQAQSVQSSDTRAVCRAFQAIFGRTTTKGEALPVPPPLFEVVKAAVEGTSAQVPVAALDALSRSYAHMNSDVLASEALEHVGVWLLRAASGRASVGESMAKDNKALHARDAIPVKDTLDSLRSDPVLPHRTDACPTDDNDDNNDKIPSAECQLSPCDHSARMVAAIETFATSLVDATRDKKPPLDVMALCRGPAQALARGLRAAIARVRTLDSPVLDLAGIRRAQHALADAIDLAPNGTGDAMGYMLGLLTSIDAVGADIDSVVDGVALQKIAAIVSNASHPLRSVVLQGLDITDVDTESDRKCDDVDNASLRGPPPHAHPRSAHAQDDLLTRAHQHHPDLFVDILGCVDLWDVGSLALASRGHYVLVTRTLREDDARGQSRRLARVALSGTLWLQHYGDSHTYDPVGHTITPSPSVDHGPLAGLDPLVLVYRRMAAFRGPHRDARLWLNMDRLAVACALGCGGAIRWYLTLIGCDLDPETLDSQEPFDRASRIAHQAGVYASPMMMRIAITASIRRIVQRQGCRRRHMAPLQVGEIQLLVKNATVGIVRGLGRRLALCRRRALPGLPALVDVLCTLLVAVRRDIDDQGWIGNYVFAGLRAAFRRAALLVLAPGTPLPMMPARVRLASALFEAAKPAPPYCPHRAL
ncbi:hypothetical protein pqer_cds_843 [Pandoravirus quercus]|uniref:DUF5867 domain-containing protein n=1 Tax=Pandoravirus quercus TaxID=2107709 RepID=A0A2U7UA57_9VIRU|nr:hypothetical protein pqer_cds_843 [Pandoravirus quercus]AVK75265.1 hypothetical protein pqer_cds_843 [Pandoravirus quercus]